MARFSQAIWKGPLPASNYKGGPAPKIGTVHHVIVGSADSALATFKNPANQVSAHFIVCGPGDSSPDGIIWQLLDTADICYAQGAGNYPPTAYIGIETSGQPSTAMTAAQCEALAQIDAWASLTHAFPLIGPVAHGTPGVAAHCNPNGTADPAWGGHTCPGSVRLAQIPPIVARALQIATPTPPPAPVTNQGVKMLARTPDGNGYWIIKADGSVWGYGNAGYYGGLNAGAPVGGGAMPAGQVAISIESSATGKGYAILSSGYALYCFGDFPYHGHP